MSDLLNSASLVMIPSGYKEDVVYSQIPTDGSGDLSFTRASNGTRINSAGLVEVCPWNLLTYSSVLSDSSYTINTLSRTDAQTDPNGGSTGALFTATSATNAYILKPFSTIIGQSYTVTVYLKGNSSGSVSIRVDGASTAPVNNVNYTTSYQQFTYTFTADSTTSTFIIGGYNTWLGSEAIYVAFPQANIGSTAKPYFPTTDRLNVPRLTYQNGGGGCPSLLLEKQSTNYAIYSQDLTQSATNISGGTVGANVTTSPDGTQNADSFTVNTATSSHAGYYETNSATNGQPFTASVFLKAGTGRYFLFRAMTNTYNTRLGVTIDLQTGTILGSNTQGSPTGTASKIENFGNGWYRVSLTMNAIGNQMSYVWATSNTATPTFNAFLDYSYTGNGTDSYYIWGMTLENSSYPTSYIPTTSSSATRVADALTLTSIPNSSATSYTIFVDFNSLVASNAGFYFSNSSGSLTYAFYFYGGTWNVFNGSAFITKYDITSTRGKIAIVHTPSSVKVFINGVNDTDSGASSNNKLAQQIYFDLSGDRMADVNSIIYFPTPLTDAEAIALTTL